MDAIKPVDFLCRLLENLRVPAHRMSLDHPVFFVPGTEALADFESPTRRMFEQVRGNTIYCVVNPFLFHYDYLLLPDTQEVLLIGPYLIQEVTDREIMKLLEEQHLPPQLLVSICQYCQTLPIVANEDLIFTMMTTLGEAIWGGHDAFEVVRKADDEMFSEISGTPTEVSRAVAEAASLRQMEERYEAERHLMHLVSQGRAHRAQMMIRKFGEVALENRAADPLRNMKNYGVVLHTLLRKAVESGGVHPMYIDKLSSQLARRLESARSLEECEQMFSTMIHKYCLLVKNHAMKSYSLLVQHVILRIDMDITADLGLKAHAQALNVNPSYLSTLFKKETGSTLTEYVARKRIDHAIYLLNSTDMQVQTIAQYCGIPDVNYFTKTFKRLIGMTPKEYRAQTKKSG